MHIRLHVKCPLLFWYFNKIWIFWTYFRKTFKYQISLKSVQLEPSCSTSTDRRTDTTELTVAFCSFAKAYKNVKFSLSKRWRNTGGSRRTAPHIPNVGTRWTWGVTFPPLPPYLGYLLNGSWMGAKQCGRLAEKKTLLHQPGTETRTVQSLTWSTPTNQLAKLTVMEGRAKGPVVSHQFLTAENRIRFQASVWRIYGEQSSITTGYFVSALVLSCQYHSALRG
jgi:hypothetical protein